MLLTILIVTCHLLGASSAVHAVMSTRTPQGTIAWVACLILCPYLAVPAYWILGRSRFHGYVTAQQTHAWQLRAVVQKAFESADAHHVSPEGKPGRLTERLAKMPMLGGNAVDLLVDGEATFASILSGIDAAQSYILFQFFIVHDDEIGREVQQRLVRQAKAGVRIYFLYDEVGCHNLPRAYLQKLRDAGIAVHDFHTRKGSRNRLQINFRNHRKVVVVDGSVAWMGGHNVGDEYLGKSAKFGHWRDTHVRIAGPAALAAQLSFVEDWHWATNTLPALDWKPKPSPAGNLPVLIVPSGPADELETAALMFTHALNSAQSRIWIASPYFVPDESVLVALQLAGLRGVDVRILIPDKPDHLLVYLAAFSYFDDSSKTGVKFYRYTDGFLHQKVMLIDKTVATVGSANFDNRSFRLNFEITAIVQDPGFADDVCRMLETDFAHARRMTAADFDERSWWFRFAVRLARLAAPIQ